MTSAPTTRPDLRYPIGRLQRRSTLGEADRRAAIEAVAATPAAFRAAVRGLDERQLDTPYRPGGWTVRQLAHHLADSHMNAFIRLRLALTEENPTVKPYDEAEWAHLPDMAMPIEPSLQIVDAVHARWVHMLRAMSPASFARALTHPENGPMTVDALLDTYAWHGRHHTAHVTALREREGWR